MGYLRIEWEEMKEEEKTKKQLMEMRKRILRVIEVYKFEMALPVILGITVELSMADKFPKETFLRLAETAWNNYEKIIDEKEEK